jgi:catechol 2,3-dioxygenase-like lactoylglutathione lyase family enzyme
MNIEVIGIDHVCFAVAEMDRSEKFYDTVMPILGFKSRRAVASALNALCANAPTHLLRHAVLAHSRFLRRPMRSGWKVLGYGTTHHPQVRTAESRPRTFWFF